MTEKQIHSIWFVLATLAVVSGFGIAYLTQTGAWLIGGALVGGAVKFGGMVVARRAKQREYSPPATEK